MKSERRHELQQNDLAVYLDRINRSVEPYSKIIVGVVVLIFVVAIGWGFYRTMESEERSNATLELIQAKGTRDPETLLAVSEAYPETVAGSWARLYQGQQYLAQGIQSLYSQPTEADQLLEDAQVAFNAAIARSDDVLLQSRAYFGIARAAESLGQLDEAIAAYEQVVELTESEAMIDKAQQRIDTLKSEEAKDFINWFAEQDFSPPDPSMPPSMPGGGSLPELPDFELPGLGDALESGGEAGEDGTAMPPEGGLELPEEANGEASGADPPADGESPAADEGDATSEETTPAQPAEETPAEAEPTTEDAPAETETPAESGSPAEADAENAAEEQEAETEQGGDGETP